MSVSRGRSTAGGASRRVTSLDAIVEAGLIIIDREGLNALSIRRLAEELGTGAMTLYSYIRTKEELLDAIASRILGEVGATAAVPGSWREQLSAMMTQLHDKLQDHPGVAALSLARSTPIPALDPIRESLLAALDRAGFSPDEAVQASTTLVAYVAGHTVIERARSGVQVEAEAARLSGLSPSDFPYLSAAATHYAHHVSPESFQAGLATLIDGLETKLGRR